MSDIEGVHSATFAPETAGNPKLGILSKGAITFHDTLPPTIEPSDHYEALSIDPHRPALFIAGLLRPAGAGKPVMPVSRLARKADLSEITVRSILKGRFTPSMTNIAALCGVEPFEWSFCLEFAANRATPSDVVAVTDGYSNIVGNYLRGLRTDKKETLGAVSKRVDIDDNSLRKLENAPAKDPRFPRLERVFGLGFKKDLALLAVRTIPRSNDSA